MRLEYGESLREIIYTESLRERHRERGKEPGLEPQRDNGKLSVRERERQRGRDRETLQSAETLEFRPLMSLLHKFTVTTTTWRQSPRMPSLYKHRIRPREVSVHELLAAAQAKRKMQLDCLDKGRVDTAFLVGVVIGRQGAAMDREDARLALQPTLIRCCTALSAVLATARGNVVLYNRTSVLGRVTTSATADIMCCARTSYSAWRTRDPFG